MPVDYNSFLPALGLTFFSLAASATTRDCSDALTAAEQASRSAQNALLVARARQSAPEYGDSLTRLADSTRRAQTACAGQASSAPAAEESADEDSGLADFLPDPGSASPSKPRRRTPAERVHGRY